jgi:hypothetical protein
MYRIIVYAVLSEGWRFSDFVREYRNKDGLLPQAVGITERGKWIT